MAPPKRAGDDASMTVRTAMEHRAIIDELAARYGVSRSDMAAIVLADALGRDRPAGKPVIALESSSLHEHVTDIVESLHRQEVQPKTA